MKGHGRSEGRIVKRAVFISLGVDIEWEEGHLGDVILLASECYRRKHPERAKILPQIN